MSRTCPAMQGKKKAFPQQLHQIGNNGFLYSTPVTLYLSRLCRWWTDHWSLFSLLSLSLTLFPRALRSLADCLAPRNASLVAGSFARPPSPCAPFPVSPLPCLRFDTVWLVLWLVTALQGPCQWFVLRESAGLALFRSQCLGLLRVLKPSRSSAPLGAALLASIEKSALKMHTCRKSSTFHCSILRICSIFQPMEQALRLPSDLALSSTFPVFFNKPGLSALTLVLTSIPPNFPFRTFAALMTYKPMTIPVCTARNLGAMALSSKLNNPSGA